MTDVKKLLDEATPLPWESFPIEADYDNCTWSGADDALATYAVNHLPDYEAAVDALSTSLDKWRERFPGYGRPEWYDEARAVLRRLRGEG